MSYAPNSVEEAQSQTKMLLQQINLNDISRKSHDKILYQLACLFRTTRSLRYIEEKIGIV